MKKIDVLNRPDRLAGRNEKWERRDIQTPTKSVRDFQQRRKILNALIVKRKTFFLSEIEKDFSDATGGYRCVDPFMSVKKYIRYLEEIRVLNKKNDLYTFVT